MDVEQVIRAVFKADPKGLEVALARLDSKASALDAKIGQVNGRLGNFFLGNDSASRLEATLAREMAAQKAAAGAKKGMTLEESALRVAAAQNEAMQAGEALRAFDELDGAVVKASSSLSGFRRGLGATATAASRVHGQIATWVLIIEVVGAAVGGIVSAIIDLNEEARRLTFASVVKELTDLVNLAGALGNRMAKAASAAERFRDVFKDAKIRDLGAQAGTARDEGRLAEAGRLERDKLIMEGQNEASDLRKKAAEARKEAFGLQIDQATTKTLIDMAEAKVADITRADFLAKLLTTTGIEDPAERARLLGESTALEKRFPITTRETELVGLNAALIQLKHNSALNGSKSPEDLLKFALGIENAASSVELGGFSGGNAAFAKGVIDQAKDAFKDLKDINLNVANARVTVNQRVTTSDPGELAGAALVAGFRSLTNRVIRPEGMTAPTGR